MDPRWSTIETFRFGLSIPKVAPARQVTDLVYAMSKTFKYAMINTG